MGDKQEDKKQNKHGNTSNLKGKNPSEPGQGGGHGDTPAKSNNPEEWKNEPGNQS